VSTDSLLEKSARRPLFFRALDMSETIPRSEAPDDPLRTGALSERSDDEKAKRRADAEARRAARNVEP
jgi:hypothetical protein